jgi:hypothetical protein
VLALHFLQLFKISFLNFPQNFLFCSNNSFYENLSDCYLTGQKNENHRNENIDYENENENMFGNENSKVSQNSTSFRIENRSIGNSSFRRYGNNGNQNNRYRNNGNAINGNINVVTPGDENENENKNENEIENINENGRGEILDEERYFYENEIERLLVRGKINYPTNNIYHF